jgi:hypothetical protein
MVELLIALLVFILVALLVSVLVLPIFTLLRTSRQTAELRARLDRLNVCCVNSKQAASAWRKYGQHRLQNLPISSKWLLRRSLLLGRAGHRACLRWRFRPVGQV